MAGPTIALLIDGENVGPGIMPSIMRRARSIGDPVVRIVFGDFSENRLSQWIAMARQFAMEIVFQPSGGKGKNSADIAMAIRAMDLLSEGLCEGLCLVSSDRDFAPLALRLARSGMKVYGMGEAKSDPSWRAACTDFFVLEQVPVQKVPVASAKKTPAPKAKAGGEKPVFSAEELRQIQTIIGNRILPEGEPWIGLPQAASAVRSEVPGLAERFCGKGKFLKNLRAWGLVTETGSGSSIKVKPRTGFVIPIRAA